MHVKCSTTTVPNSIKIGNLVFGSEPVGYGPTSTTGFYNGIDPPINGYTIYYATSGMTIPSIVVANNDTELIYWAKAYGGDTTNLLYDNGVINWSITNLGSSIVSISTIIANNKYRITCTTGSQFRFYMLLSKLTNGQTYTLSYKYNIISGTTFSMSDWNDTPISNINNIDYITYKFSSATGSRATYDSTYRFMDFNINTGAIVDIWDVQLEQKSTYTPFTNGTRIINSIEDGLSYLRNSDKTAVFNINHAGIVTEGLVLNLDAGMVLSYPRSGNTWYDLSDNSNNGTLLNSTLYSNGSILFNNLNSNYVNIGNISALDSGDITIDFWAKSVNSAVIIGKHYNNFEIRIEPTYFGGYVGISGGWKEINDALVTHNISNYATNINNYTYIFSYTKNYINFYSNGTYRGTFSGSTLGATITHFTTGQSLVLGQRGDFTGYLSGEISTINIYNREITEVEVIQNYNANVKNILFGSPATASQLLAQNSAITNGVYWLSPISSPIPIQAYCDFTTANGPWVHVGTAVGNTRGLYTYKSTWANRTTDSGNITDPYNTTTSSFNAESFIYCKGNNIMIKYGLSGYTQASGFTNESWRDVYSFLNSVVTWPSQPSYNRQLTITTRSGITAPNTQGSGLIYGSRWTTATNQDYFYVYCFDSGGDTYAYLTTGSYGVPISGQTAQVEADHGIGSNENGPNASIFPGDDQALTPGIAYDAGTNDTTDSGATTIYNNIPFSLWIKN